MDETAFLRLARHNRGPTGAASAEARCRVELETTVRILGMAVDAAIDEQGPNLLLKKIALLGRDRRLGCDRAAACRCGQRQRKTKQKAVPAHR
jgi:hypothetical protein